MNDILQTIALSLQTFKTHRMRSFLTTLGIIIGVTTVIAILSLIEGLNRSVASSINSLGSNVIYVMKYSFMMGHTDFEEIQKRKDFTMEDAEVLKKLSSIGKVAPVFANRQVPWLYYKDKKVNNIEFIGSTEDYFEVLNYTVVSGRPLTQDDITHRRMVCIIGDYVRENLFPNESPVGLHINVRGKTLVIIGVLDAKGSFLGQTMDNNVLVPISVIEKIFPKPQGMERVFNSLMIATTPKDPKKIDQTIDDIRELMRRRRGLSLDDKEDFSINTQQMLMDIYKSITQVGFVAIIAIAAISLIVGGIGIMNIMLVSVAERTREIGILKAVGASNNNVMLQFLAESVTLALIGGLIGIIFGILLASLISAVSPLKAAVAFWMIMLGFGFSAAVGIFFGIYPARKAASLNPIEALRYE